MKNLAEVPEAGATGSVATIYDDIRAVLGTSFVNLVYRHLATEPTILDWAWRAIRPHMVDGALAAQAAQLRRTVAAEVADWPCRATTAPRPAACDEIARLVRMYNEANSLNLLALTHLLAPERAGLAPSRPLSDAPTGHPPPDMHRSGQPPTGLPALPGLPDLARLDADERARIARLNRFGEDSEPTIVASLYRHLAAWRGALTFTEAVLTPLAERGLLTSARGRALFEARGIADRQPLAMPAQPPAFERRFGAALRSLSAVTISKMLPVGQVLADAFSDDRPSTGVGLQAAAPLC